MSKQRFRPEFKEEAVRQIVERGYKVADVADALEIQASRLLDSRLDGLNH